MLLMASPWQPNRENFCIGRAYQNSPTLFIINNQKKNRIVLFFSESNNRGNFSGVAEKPPQPLYSFFIKII